MSDTDGKFSKDNQPKPRGKAKRTMILDALKRSGKTEAEFWDAVLQKAMHGGNDADGDTPMMVLVAKKLFPDTKPTYETYEVELKGGETRLDRAEAILSAATIGLLPVDVAEKLIRIHADVAKIEEVDDLEARLTAVEALQESE